MSTTIDINNHVQDKLDRYCIIGAGPAGLLAARAFGRAGIAYDQFDKNPDVGGIWDIRNSWSPMYESAHFISSKTVSNLPGYAMPDTYPDYPNHRQIFAYLQSFARDHDLYEHIEFGVAVEGVQRVGEMWRVRFDSGVVSDYRGLIICSGNTWDPNLPEYAGHFTGETMHSVRYREGAQFRDKRVLIVGGGNSGCDIACDAALNAQSAGISLRRGYHFIPKHIFGKPADLFASKVSLPPWAESRVFGALLKMLVGDLRRYGLAAPDHKVMESHPILNTQLLHYLSHGDILPHPDVQRFEGKTVHFVDGTTADYDLIVYATGYKVTYPFMDRGHFEWISKYPDLYLSGIHREYDNLCCLGLHQTDGGAFDFFAMQADMMANFVLEQETNSSRASDFRQQKSVDRPNLSGGLSYVDSPRHATYVRKSVYRRYCESIFRKYGWRQFSTERGAVSGMSLSPPAGDSKAVAKR